MTSETIPAQSIAAPAAVRRPTLPAMVMALMLLTSAFWVAGLAAPTAAHAANMVDQCNSHGPATAGATTALRCTVTVVNTISGTATSSTTTVTRLCTLGPCSTPNGTSTTSSTSLVTAVRQCNSSDNDAAHPITCNVKITNNIWRDTSGARPLTAPTVTQCVGSGKGGLGVVGCEPGPVSGAMVTQCNGSGNGGGGTVHCTVDQSSRVSGAIPIMVNQCNGSGNVGGSAVTCTASIITNITGPAVAQSAATTTPAPTTTPAATASTNPSPTESTIAAAVIVPNGAGPAAGPDHSGPLMLGSGLTLVAAVSTLLYRRYAPKGLLSRYAPKDLMSRLARKG
jgi:hypothetical protein